MQCAIAAGLFNCGVFVRLWCVRSIGVCLFDPSVFVQLWCFDLIAVIAATLGLLGCCGWKRGCQSCTWSCVCISNIWLLNLLVLVLGYSRMLSANDNRYSRWRAVSLPLYLQCTYSDCAAKSLGQSTPKYLYLPATYGLNPGPKTPAYTLQLKQENYLIALLVYFHYFSFAYHLLLYCVLWTSGCSRLGGEQ